MENKKTLENILDLMVKRAKYVMKFIMDHNYENTDQTRMVLYGFTQYYSALYDVTASQSLQNALDDIWSSVRWHLRGKQDYTETLVDIDNIEEMFKAL